jgi:hypothetical protein
MGGSVGGAMCRSRIEKGPRARAKPADGHDDGTRHASAHGRDRPPARRARRVAHGLLRQRRSTSETRAVAIDRLRAFRNDQTTRRADACRARERQRRREPVDVRELDAVVGPNPGQRRDSRRSNAHDARRPSRSGRFGGTKRQRARRARASGDGLLCLPKARREDRGAVPDRRPHTAADRTSERAAREGRAGFTSIGRTSPPVKPSARSPICSTRSRACSNLPTSETSFTCRWACRWTGAPTRCST